jgi:hypothetical protein
MMLKASHIVNLANEPQHGKDLYGIGVKETDNFGVSCFWPVATACDSYRSATRVEDPSLDAYDDMKTHVLVRAVDTPIARSYSAFNATRIARQHACCLQERNRAYSVVPKPRLKCATERSRTHTTLVTCKPPSCSSSASTTKTWMSLRLDDSLPQRRRARSDHEHRELSFTSLEQRRL